MDIVKQVCTRTQGVVLKGLGISHKGAFVYEYDPVNRTHNVEYNTGVVFNWPSPAYTCAELGEMINAFPDTTTINYNNGTYTWRIDAHESEKMLGTEAECRADILIYMLSHGLIQPDVINQRLKNA